MYRLDPCRRYLSPWAAVEWAVFVLARSVIHADVVATFLDCCHAGAPAAAGVIQHQGALVCVCPDQPPQKIHRLLCWMQCQVLLV